MSSHSSNLSKLQLRPLLLRSRFGAEIHGLDWTLPLSLCDARTLRQAWARHGVLVFPGADIDDWSQARFARRFGHLCVFRPAGEDGGLPPQVYRSVNVDDAGRSIVPDSLTARLLMLNWLWHVDACYRRLPTRGVVLRAVEAAGDGGDTIFVDMAAAYAELPAATRSQVDALVARHSFAYMVRQRGLPALSADEAAALPAVDHPLVRRHADGRRSLFLSPPYMECILGMSHEASQGLIAELTAWSTQERFCYCHRWRPNDMVIWDNRWTMHRVTPYDISRERRVMHGCVIVGGGVPA